MGTGGSAPVATGGTPAGTFGGVEGTAAASTANAKLQFDGSLALRRVQR